MRIVDVLAAFWRRWPIILACVVVCAGVAALYSKLTPKIYRASTVISVTAARFDYGNGLAAQQLIANYALQLSGQDLLRQLDQQLKLDKSPAELEQMIKASSDNTTLTINLSVDDTDAQRAADIANGLSQLFVANTQAYNQAHLNPDVDVRIYQAADRPTSPNRPKTKINTLAGALLGLLVGCGAAYLLDIWDDRLRGEHDVEAGLGLPLLGSIPRLPPSKGAPPAQSAAAGAADADKVIVREQPPVGARK